MCPISSKSWWEDLNPSGGLLWLVLTLSNHIHLEGGLWLQDWVDEVWTVLTGFHSTHAR